jgi:uncharacterized circularly permuted ATP-grasp superfamily protein/uncharacterized alpha-E superfamily protein
MSITTSDSTPASSAATAARPPRGLAGQYKPAFTERDEMTEPDGALRHHWRPFVSMMDDLGHAEVVSRWEQARRLIRENGITHNIYGAPDGMARPWTLDLIPLLVTNAEWTNVSQSLIQRAHLLNALLTDLYGPATCVTSGTLPPELLYANPWFMRAMHGVAPPHGQWLHFYGADLVRCPDGAFRVLADRTQNPSGAGYCLENRIVLNRALPTVFRGCNVHRLAPFFISLRQTLASLAVSNQDNPRVVLLTPGPYNETYFEHAYLARYLGYTLVQGNDLTVRDCRVYLKTLSGLHRVDVILRRVDDDFCDPLELHSRSFLGVPGLCQAVREKTVAVANAIGSGILQVPAFLPFLPALCRHFLGQDLKLNSIDTWWCGQPKELQYVLENLHRLVIKPAYPVGGSDPVFGDELTKEQRAELSAHIRVRPIEFIAQAPMASYAAPVLIHEEVQSRRFVVRAYLAAERESYTVMPGALTRVTSSPESRVVSLQKGGGSKDTWILADGPVSEVTLLASPDTPVRLTRGSGDLSSRVADDLFWLGRYVQRAEAVVRLARCLFNRLADPNLIEDSPVWQILARQLLGHPVRPGQGMAARIADELFSPIDPTALRATIQHIRGLVDVLRDRISYDAWQSLRDIERALTEFKIEKGDRIIPVIDLLNRLVVGFLSFSGMSSESMTRGLAWFVLDTGTRIERGIAVAKLIDGTLSVQIDDEPLLLDALLEITDSSLTYRRRYLTTVTAPAVADLIVADETNPRSVAYQSARIERNLAALPGESPIPTPRHDHQLAMKLCAALQLVEFYEICAPDDGKRPQLSRLCAKIIRSLWEISDQLSQTYFDHAAAHHREAPTDGEPAL